MRFTFGSTSHKQIFTGRLPFFMIKRDETVIFKVTNRNLPLREDYSEISPEIWSLLEKCWQFDPVQRPSMQRVSFELDFNAARRSNHRLSVIEPGKNLHQLTSNSTAVFFSRSHMIPHVRNQVHARVLNTARRRTISLSINFDSKPTSAPYPCQWVGCCYQFNALKDCQDHELYHEISIDNSLYPSKDQFLSPIHLLSS
jgi:hypothetical protein